MPRALQVAALPRVETLQLPAAASLAALGIVYGDIGASPLYAFKQAAAAGGTLSPEGVMGVASLILWSLILIVSLKYAILIMRADNHGEGGIVALLALLDVRHAPPRSLRAFLLIVGLIGVALLYGDGVITPAISVLSAVEGLKLDAPRLAPLVVPISVAILVGGQLKALKREDGSSRCGPRSPAARPGGRWGWGSAGASSPAAPLPIRSSSRRSAPPRAAGSSRCRGAC
jgi:KUP system potassium uptake protein